MSAPARVKVEPECSGAGSCGARGATDQVRVKEELMTEASFTEEPPYELYADHVVKDELVLGPERPHRPSVGLTVHSRAPAADKRLQASPQKRALAPQPEIKDCYVRLERLLLPPVKTRSSCSIKHETSALDACKYTLRPKINLERCVNAKSEGTCIDKYKKLKVNTRIQGNVNTNSTSIQSKEHDTKRQDIKTSLHNKDEVKSTKQTNRKKVKISENHPYICDTCGKICKFRHTLIQHLRYHLPDTIENLQIGSSIKKPYSCNICQKGFTTLGSLKRHLNIHAGKKRHTCEVCGMKFLESTCFKRHMLIHSIDKPEIPCDVCKKTFTTSSTLKVHKRNVHLKLKLYACDLCEKKFSTTDVLRKHRTTHFVELPYICDICDKRFRNIDRLKFHKRIHTYEKPYSCDNCNKGFRVLYKLNKHKLLHLNGKEFSCTACKIMFATSSELDEHRRNNKIPYECEICNKVFCESRYFKKHLHRTHGLGRIYFCDICRKDYKTPDALKKHKQTHRGYSCGICQQKFADNITFRKHKKIPTH